MAGPAEPLRIPSALRLIALWQLVGGAVGLVTGLVVLLRLLRAPGGPAWGAVLLVLLVAALHLLAAGSGVLLWRGARWGFVGSLLVQFMQLTMISTEAHRSFFRLLGALYLEISGDIAFDWRTGSGYAELLAPGGERASIGLNLFAAVALLLLLRYRAGQRARMPRRADEVFR